METSLLWKLVQTTAKGSSKFIKKNHTCRWYDDTQPCKISCPNSTLFVRYKNNKFQPRKLSDDLLEICYFYISQTKSSLDKIFYKIVCHHIICMCNFFGKFRRLFYRGLHGFSQQAGFHSIRCQVCLAYLEPSLPFWAPELLYIALSNSIFFIGWTV